MNITTERQTGEALHDGALRGGTLLGAALQDGTLHSERLQGALLAVPGPAADGIQRGPSGTHFLRLDHQRGCAGSFPAPKGGSRCAVPAIPATGHPARRLPFTSPRTAACSGNPGGKACGKTGRGPLSQGAVYPYCVARAIYQNFSVITVRSACNVSQLQCNCSVASLCSACNVSQLQCNYSV